MSTLKRNDFIAGTAALAAGFVPQLGRAQELTAMHIVSAPTIGARTALYAVQSGIFKKHGLNVDVLKMTSGGAALSALIGGSIQVDYVNVLSLIQAHVKGVPLQIVAPGSYYNTDRPYALLFVTKDSPIRSGRDLNGKTIASGSLLDINALCTMAWIDANGGDSKSIKAIELTNSAILPALDDGRIDAAPLVPPYQTQALDSGKYRVLGKPYDALAKRFEVAAWASTSDYIGANQQAAQRFASAMREAAAIANATPAKTLDLVASFTGVERDIVARSPGPADPPYLTGADLQPMIEAAVKYGLIPRGFSGDELINAVARKPA